MRLLEMPLIFVLAATGVQNVDSNANNIVFTTKDSQLYICVVTLSVKDNQKLSKFLAEWFERSVYWNEHKTKS